MRQRCGVIVKLFHPRHIDPSFPSVATHTTLRLHLVHSCTLMFFISSLCLIYTNTSIHARIMSRGLRGRIQE